MPSTTRHFNSRIYSLFGVYDSRAAALRNSRELRSEPGVKARVEPHGGQWAVWSFGFGAS
jgi:hypothetical protein